MNFWKNKQVLITGGAGFIGQHLMKKLLELEVKNVDILDNFERADYQKFVLKAREYNNSNWYKGNVTWCYEDITSMDEQDLLDVFYNVDVVFHLASKVGSYQYYLKQAGDVAVTNSLVDARIIQAAIKTEVPHFFYASSTHIYSKDCKGWGDAFIELDSDEIMWADDLLSYGWTKLWGERLLELNFDKFETCVLGRINGAYGSGQDYDVENGSVIPVLARKIAKYPEESVNLLSTGEETRCYCHVSDVVQMMILSVENNLFGPYNIGESTPIKIKDIAKTLIDISGKKIKLELSNNVAVLKEQNIDCSEIYQACDYIPEVSMKKGLTTVYKDVKERVENEQ